MRIAQRFSAGIRVNDIFFAGFSRRRAEALSRVITAPRHSLLINNFSCHLAAGLLLSDKSA